MKKAGIIIGAIGICFFMLSGKKISKFTAQEPVLDEVATFYKSHFVAFQKAVNTLDTLAEHAVLSEFGELKNQVELTRLAYKKIEFIFDYYQTSYNGTYINAAPLPKISEYFETDIIEPCGLQALDEAVFKTASVQNLKQIQELTKALKTRVDFIAQVHLPLRLKSSQIIECIRSGLVRVFTLGLTGFDTPGSGNGLKESYVSLQSMKRVFLYFEIGLLPESQNKFKFIKKTFEKGEALLKQPLHFNDFDRLLFLKEVINPLYAALLDFQNLNAIKLEPYKKHAQNYQAKHIFDKDFIDTNFYSELVYLPLDNPKTIQLGKLLFKDPRLSNANSMSCLSCHNPNKGFTDALPKSRSNRHGVFTARNSPTLINAGYATRYFWDMRAFDLEKQVAHVIDNDLEFNTNFKAIIEKLNKDETYLKLFKEAYGGISKQDINERAISNAIAAYVNSLKSFNSAFDKYVRDETKVYPEKAKRGFNLFMGKAACGSCHFAPTFSGLVPPFYLESESEVLGITKGLDTLNPILDEDLGRIDNGLNRDKQPYFKHAFKTVTVRNIALTAPYMHNGAFNTLEDVLHFYNHGGGAGMGLAVDHQTLSPTPLNLSKQDIEAIIAFMETLTDTSGL